MTDEEMRIEIAKECGWKAAQRSYKHTTAVEYGWTNPTGDWVYPSRGGPPDYLHDRNAMVGAILTLTDAQRAVFGEQLAWELGYTDDYYTCWDVALISFYEFATAPCEKLAKAFLQTVNLWVD